VKIALIFEGNTERVFLPFLRGFLETRLAGKMPHITQHKYDGRIPKNDKLRRVVENLLSDGNNFVIALTDVYTGSQPPEFDTADDAKRKMRDWVGVEPRFHPHVALHDFEAWLLPYWMNIQKIAGHNKSRPGVNPETVNHLHPPSDHITEIFRLGGRRSYVKPREAAKILKNQDLMIAINECSELKAFVNTIFAICGSDLIP
jgi:hypothetical protein